MKETRQGLHRWQSDSEVQARLTGNMVRWAGAVRRVIREEAYLEAERSGVPEDLVRVAMAAAWLEASRDILTIEAARARVKDFPLGLLSEAAGRAPGSSPRRDWAGFDDLVAQFKAAQSDPERYHATISTTRRLPVEVTNDRS